MYINTLNCINILEIAQTCKNASEFQLSTDARYSLKTEIFHYHFVSIMPVFTSVSFLRCYLFGGYIYGALKPKFCKCSNFFC